MIPLIINLIGVVMMAIFAPSNSLGIDDGSASTNFNTVKKKRNLYNTLFWVGLVLALFGAILQYLTSEYEPME